MTSIDEAEEGRRTSSPTTNTMSTATTEAFSSSPPPASIDVIGPVPSGTRITLTLPDDFHHHFRDGEACGDVLRHASLRFGRAIAMPNLKVSFSMSLGGNDPHSPLSSLLKELSHCRTYA